MTHPHSSINQGRVTKQAGSNICPDEEKTSLYLGVTPEAVTVR